MKYVHQDSYGQIGKNRTAKPLFAIDKDHVYEMKNGLKGPQPIYKILNNKLYSTEFHPEGPSNNAMYQIKGNNITATRHNVSGASQKFLIRGNLKA